MKKIRKRLTYANVMSSLAVFLVLGGATAFAASKITSKQLAANSVTTAKIKKSSVTTSKIKDNSITTSKVANGAITGAKLNLGSVGKVPSAVNADHATNADNATNAGNANTVAGNTIRKFFYAREENTGAQNVLSLDGLTLTADCSGGTPTLNATTSAPALIHTGGTYGFPVAYYVEDDNFGPGETVELLEEEGDSVQGTFTYVQPNGTVVTGTYESEEGAFESGTDCVISGHAIG